MSDIIDRIKDGFDKKYILQIIGAIAIIVALVLTWQAQAAYALYTLIGVGVLDLYLHFAKKDTISQWIHHLFPRQIDVGIAITILLYTWHVFGPIGFLPVLIGVIMGHLFWQE